MALIEYTFGDLIELYIVQNSDGKYGADSAIGINIDKEIRVMRGDSSRKELERFYIVPPGAFVYNPRGSRKLGLGYNDTSNTYVTTFNNMIFKIRDCASDIILPRYLFMYLARKEWDRKAEFLSWGSSTEVFSWDIFCETSITLPPLPIQQKYVDVYNSMLANQRNYERGLENLRQAVFAEIDIVKHSADKVPVGDLLEEIDLRNTDGSITNIQGINIEKQFMPSLTDTSSVNIRNYKVLREGQFAYSSMQTGRDECIRIALYDKDIPALISPAYSVLQMKELSAVAEYIMLWFTRPETDRYGWFASDASIRANLDLDRFYEIQIPMPDTAKQQAIANIYIAYMLRREINEQLKTQIRDICPILIKGSLEEGNRIGG